ncbi:MAG TPA: DNA-3-methyladenine glycosylase [Verrucomicrobiae bacterium]|nr:DNA-3-methyladenine glycosylase [Verrucomicrobiae bacterium]
MRPLPRSFYEPSADKVAPELLGHLLLRKLPKGLAGGPIVEAEAYLFEDPASHSFGGESARNRSMYGPPGHAYVYFIYGVHWCVNAVCAPKGVGEAILIRAIEPNIGKEFMKRATTNGPGKLCAALDITRSLDGADLCDATSGLFIAENPDLKGFLKDRGPVVRTKRIGITKSAELPLRFCLKNSPCLSRKIISG